MKTIENFLKDESGTEIETLEYAVIPGLIAWCRGDYLGPWRYLGIAIKSRLENRAVSWIATAEIPGDITNCPGAI